MIKKGNNLVLLIEIFKFYQEKKKQSIVDQKEKD